jgi:hypothetical protein
MDSVSKYFDMDFSVVVYTLWMTGAISQMQMVYVAEEDRVLFRVNSLDKQEFRFWITRRYAMLLVKVLKDHKQVDPDVSTQVTTEAKEAVQAFKKEKAMSEARFNRNFNEDGNEFPLGQSIQLAFKLSYGMKDDGNLHLSIQPREGKGINIVINQEINITLTQLLLTASQQGGWGLDESLKENSGIAEENVVIN